MTNTSEPHKHHAHMTPLGYFAIYLALLGLTLTTVLLANNLGAWEIPVALGIATAKTLLVALFFMHLRQANALTQVVAGTGVVFLAILLSLTLADYWTRGWVPQSSDPKSMEKVEKR